MFIDIHTHLDQYGNDEHGQPEQPGIIQRGLEAGVGAIIAAGVTLESTAECIRLARENERVFAGAGCHPQDLDGELDQQALDRLYEMAGDENVIVMSEIGLDHQPQSPDHDLQERAFRAQIEIARDRRLPVVFHNRDATEPVLRVLREEDARTVGGAAHYFQGDLSYAHALMDMGMFISLAKPLLRLPELQQTACQLPLSSIVLETDCYPQPFKKKREKWTEPRDIPLVAAKLAELHGVSTEEVMEATTANVLRMLGGKCGGVRRLVGTDRRSING
ncbi:MAG: TatD family hydrolase [Chloroflexota bacterium]